FLSALLFLQPFPHPEHMPIRMPQVHLAHAPRHVRRRERDLHSSCDAVLVHRVDVIHPHRHPHSLVALLVALYLKRGGVLAAAAASLRALAEEDARFLARSHRAKTSEAFPSPTVSSIP